MSGPRKSYWAWLTGETAIDEKIVEQMARLFSEPEEFWNRLQETVKEIAAADDADSATEEISCWLQRPTPWLQAIRNSVDGLPGSWVGRPREFFARAARIIYRVLRPIPKTLRHSQNARRAASGRTGGPSERSEGDVQLRDLGSVFGDRDYRWRFYDDPEVIQRRTIDFPVAAVFDQDSDAAYGQVISMTVEILDPGTGIVIPHPLLELGALRVERDFRNAANAALVAASSLAGTCEHPVTAGFFSRQFFERKIGRLAGVSAGGAFALAFSRALTGKLYDQRVIVISTVDEEGNLGIVRNDGTGRQQSGPSFLNLKADGIVKHNKKLLPNDPKYIDTVAVVADQAGPMEEALRRADHGRLDFHVAVIEELT